MSLDLELLGLVEIIRLQKRLSAVLSRRFERQLALGFSDIVDSTAYFQRFGDEVGRRQQQRHLDLLQEILPAAEGRVVDTAGDGAFVCFPRSELAVEAFTHLQQALARDNSGLAREHPLATRTAIHRAPVLTDDRIVVGDAVNICARLAKTARGGEILVTRAAFMELPSAHRLRCRALPAVKLAGVVEPVEVLAFEWRDPRRFPIEVRIEETGECIALPDQDTITFGRLREIDGTRVNDIGLMPVDPRSAEQISRWHFELRGQPDGLTLRSVSNQLTEVDGFEIARGAEVQTRRGSVVRFSGILTLTFLPAEPPAPDAAETKTRQIEP